MSMPPEMPSHMVAERMMPADSQKRLEEGTPSANWLTCAVPLTSSQRALFWTVESGMVYLSVQVGGCGVCGSWVGAVYIWVWRGVDGWLRCGCWVDAVLGWAL